MARRACIITLLIVTLAVTGLTGQGRVAAQGGQLTFSYQGTGRSYFLTVPAAYDPADPLPLVIALHPMASSGRAMAALTGLDAAAERDGFIAVFPDSLTLRWNDYRTSDRWPPDQQPVDDAGFIGALIDQLSADYAVDPARIYLAGFGHGGTLAYRLACESPQRFAKVAVVGALAWDYTVRGCPAASDPVSLLMIMGSEDPFYPFAGQDLQQGADAAPLATLSAEDTIRFWLERDGCDADAVREVEEAGARLYDSCEGDAAVAFLTQRGVGSNWLRRGDYRLNQFGVDTTDLVTQYFLGEGDAWLNLAGPLRGAEQVLGGAARSAVVYVPPDYDPAEPTPLVIALHGRSDSGPGMAYLSDLNPVAAREGFIVAYPNGLNNEWNYVRGEPGWEMTQDDTAFLKALAEDLALDLNIDPERRYVMGFSNGGFMTQRMACEASDTFAAFGVVSATLFPGFIDLCEGTRPVPILFMHGTLDTAVPWQGIQYGDYVMSLSVPDTVLFWALHNTCDPDRVDYKALPQSGDSPGTQAYRYTFWGCADGADIRYYAIDGGGHNLPGVAGRFDPSWAGTVNMDLHAATEIWDFFESQTLTRGE